MAYGRKEELIAYSRNKERSVFLRHAIGHKPLAIRSGLTP